MKTKMLCGLWLATLALAGAAWGQDVTVPVKFTVDMSVQITAGNFNPATMGVEVRGPFNGWSGTALAREGTSSNYSGTLSITGAPNSSVAYKYFGSGTGGLGWESFGGDRTFNLGPAGATQVLDTVYFSNQGPTGPTVTVPVKFSVDMAVQIGSGSFNAATQSMAVRGGFNGWGDGSNLAREGTTTVYSGTFSVTGAQGGAIEYKFYKTGVGDAGYETIGNRSFNLGPAGATQALDTVYFNNEAPAGPTLTFTGGTWDPAAVGAYPFELTRANGVGDAIVLTSSNTNAVTVPASAAFAAGSNTVSFDATVVSLTAGEATIVASNVASGAWAEYTVKPVAPYLAFTGGTWNPSATGGYLYRLERSASVGNEIIMTSTASNVLTVAPSVNFTAGTNAIDILATVVSLTNGPATLIASNVATGAWAEYVVTPVGPILSIDGPWLVESLGALTYTLVRTPSVGETVTLRSSNTNVLWVPADLLYGAGSYTSTFPATAVGYGAATIVASNAASGAWAEYNVTVQMPSNPDIGPITFVPGTGAFSFAVPGGFTLAKVQGAGTALVGGDLLWTDLVQDADYTLAAGVVTILTKAVGAPAQRLVRIWVTATPPPGR